MATFQNVLALDEALLLRVCRYQRPCLTRFFRGITHLADAKSLTALGLVLLLGRHEAAGKLGWRLGLASGGAALLVQILKRWLRRQRPSLGIEGFVSLVAHPDALSFPSGHTAASVALAVAWAGQGQGLGPMTASLAGLVGLSRVYLGVHYPLDVAAGVVLGVLSGTAVQLLA